MKRTLDDDEIPIIYHTLKKLVDENKIVHFTRGFNDEDFTVLGVSMAFDSGLDRHFMRVTFMDSISGDSTQLMWLLESMERLELFKQNSHWRFRDPNYN